MSPIKTISFKTNRKHRFHWLSKDFLFYENYHFKCPDLWQQNSVIPTQTSLYFSFDGYDFLPVLQRELEDRPVTTEH